MSDLIPYLVFPGTAEEALHFYIKALGGEMISLARMGDQDPSMPENEKNRVMHAIISICGAQVMASDGRSSDTITSGNNISISLNFHTMDAIEKAFNNMSAGSNITMPLQDTFWGARFGMLTDKYGINWMFNHDIKQ
ncbi:MAG: VOC family protein [Bacteroidetes bacterium]|nr:VOC family protein [Bacteroidota bacterium]